MVDPVDRDAATGRPDALEGRTGVRRGHVPVHEDVLAGLGDRDDAHVEVRQRGEEVLEVDGDRVGAVHRAGRKALVRGIGPELAQRVDVARVDGLERPADELTVGGAGRWCGGDGHGPRLPPLARARRASAWIQAQSL